MNTPTPNAPTGSHQASKAETGSGSATAAGHLAADPSIPAPGAVEKQERICDAPSDPHKPAGVESVDKGA